jgi:hypothetical protein
VFKPASADGDAATVRSAEWLKKITEKTTDEEKSGSRVGGLDAAGNLAPAPRREGRHQGASGSAPAHLPLAPRL